MARKQNTIHYIYKTTCLVTGRYYIGMHSTNDLEDGYMGSGKRLRRSIRKYGIENHKKETLEFFENRELLIDAEKKIITPEMITDNNCMNLKGGGEGGFISEEQQRYRSQCGGMANAKKIITDQKYRDKVFRVLKENREKNIRDGVFSKRKKHPFSGKQHTDKTKKLISDKAKERTGDKNSQYGTCWITKDGENKKIKKEDIKKWVNYGWINGRKIN